MKYFNLPLLLCVVLFSSCLSDEEKRLQTDQMFEGEEIFAISYTLNEHVMYAFQPYEYYQDTVNHSAISGCPVVTVDGFSKEVRLSFGDGDCPSNKPLRSGDLILNYMDTLETGESRVRVNYEDYWVKGIKLGGIRHLDVLDSTSSGISLLDSLMDFTITDANSSSSKISGIFTHEVLFDVDSIRYYTTTGSATGRNLAGRPFSMEISDPKYYDGNCLRLGFFVAEEGEERWAIDRTVEADVNHVVRYVPAEECNNTALIQLANRTELSKTQ